MSSNMPTTSGDSRQADLAYVAGYLDGEGCFQANFQPNQKHFRVNVANTYKPTLLWLADKFGGSVCKGSGGNKLGKKVCWNWVVTGQSAYDLLVAAIPYLREKREHAKFMLTIWDGRADTTRFKALVAEKKARWGRAAAETKREGAEKSVMQ